MPPRALEFLTVGIPQTFPVSQDVEVVAHDVRHGKGTGHKVTALKWIEG